MNTIWFRKSRHSRLDRLQTERPRRNKERLCDHAVKHNQGKLTFNIWLHCICTKRTMKSVTIPLCIHHFCLTYEIFIFTTISTPLEKKYVGQWRLSAVLLGCETEAGIGTFEIVVLTFLPNRGCPYIFSYAAAVLPVDSMWVTHIFQWKYLPLE